MGAGRGRRRGAGGVPVRLGVDRRPDGASMSRLAIAAAILALLGLLYVAFYQYLAALGKVVLL